MPYTAIPTSGGATLSTLSGLTDKRLVFGSSTGAGAQSADATFDDTTNDLTISASEASGTVGLTLANTNATAGAARLTIQTETGGGDADLRFSVNGVTDWTVGADNSATDNFVIAKSTALGTTNVLEITSGRNFAVGPVGGTHRMDATENASGTLVTSAVRETSNSASASARFLAEVAGTTASDAYSQWSVVGTRDFVAGIDTSVSGQPFVFSVGTALGTTDVYSINSSGEMIIGTGLPVASEKLRLRLTNDNDFGVESTATTARSTIKAIAGVNSVRFQQFGSTAAGTTNGINNTSLSTISVAVGSFMITAPDSTSQLYFAANGAIKATINNQRLLLTNRLNQAKGADVASAGTLTLGIDGDSFDITGTTNIDYITTTNWTAGARALLQFDGILTVNHNTGSVPGSTAAILLASGAPFVTTAGDTLTLWYDGVTWRETTRSVI